VRQAQRKAVKGDDGENAVGAAAEEGVACGVDALYAGEVDGNGSYVEEDGPGGSGMEVAEDGLMSRGRGVGKFR